MALSLSCGHCSRAVNTCTEVSVTEIQPKATAEYCRFCGDRTADISGEAYTYVRLPDEVGREDGVFWFTICRECTLQDRDNVEQAAFALPRGRSRPSRHLRCLRGCWLPVCQYSPASSGDVSARERYFLVGHNQRLRRGNALL